LALCRRRAKRSRWATGDAAHACELVVCDEMHDERRRFSRPISRSRRGACNA